ncbi:MAG TPA: ribonuclease Y [candidate division Zixibacteria bacterium]|jgi:ribonuclease Y|nr:ribonuclease Y [candidate division Zixibacteria bacterium]
MDFILLNLGQLWMSIVALVIVFSIIGLGAGMIWGRRKTAELKARAEKRTQRMVKELEVQGKATALEEKQKWHQIRADQEEEMAAKQTAIDERDEELAYREKESDQRSETVHTREEDLSVREDEVNDLNARLKSQEIRLKQTSTEYRTRLESLARLTAEEAKKQLYDEMIHDVKQEAEYKVREIMESVRTNANWEAKKIIALAIDRCAVDQSTQSSVAVVPLPNDQIKARIIGKDGRNIRTFEAASEVKVMVDDTPEAVVISCFAPIRREVARAAMTELVSSGKITQTRIEEVIERAKGKVEKRLLSEGQETVDLLKLEPMHDEIKKLLGRLRFRTSYGQNALEHSKEVAFLTGMMAAELGMDEILARRCGLLHDVGKALDHEMEGSHPEIGLDYAERYGEPEEVKNAIVAHHNDEDEEITSPITFLVSAADAISGARPGARRNDPEDYIKRVIALEELARSFDGVAEAYAINAGREIRVMVKTEEVDDAQTHVLAFEMAQKIRNDLTYPGHVKVTAIRGKIAQEWTSDPGGNQQKQRGGGRRRQHGRRDQRPSRSSGSHAAAG